MDHQEFHWICTNEKNQQCFSCSFIDFKFNNQNRLLHQWMLCSVWSLPLYLQDNLFCCVYSRSKLLNELLNNKNLHIFFFLCFLFAFFQRFCSATRSMWDKYDWLESLLVCICAWIHVEICTVRYVFWIFLAVFDFSSHFLVANYNKLWDKFSRTQYASSRNTMVSLSQLQHHESENFNFQMVLYLSKADTILSIIYDK